MAKKWTIEKIEQLIVQRDFSLDEKNSLQPITNKSLNEQNDFKKLTGLEVSSISEFNYHSILMRIFKRVLLFCKDSVPLILDETSRQKERGPIKSMLGPLSFYFLTQLLHGIP